MKKAETVSSPDQAQDNFNNKNNIFTQEKCFYCDSTPCLHHTLDGNDLIVSLCYKHSKELFQKDAQAFVDQLQKDVDSEGYK